jgi:hypothetical protein
MAGYVGQTHNYFSMRTIRGGAIKLAYAPMQTVVYTAQAYTPVAPSGINAQIDTTVAGFWLNLLRPYGINQFTCLLAVGNAVNNSSYLYGSRVNAGYVGMLNKYFNKDANAELLVCGVAGNLFEEVFNTAEVFTIECPLATAATVTPDPITLIATLAIVNAENVYLAGDVITRTTLTDTRGTSVVESYTILTVGTGIVTVLASIEYT